MKIDFHSSDWHGVSSYLETELERLRRANEAVGLPEAQTSAIRGEIRLCRKLLALPEQADRDKSLALFDFPADTGEF